MKIIKYLKKYWYLAILAPLFMLGEAGMDLFQPAMMAEIVDDGVLGIHNGGVGDMNIVIGTGIRMIALIFAGALCGVLSGVFSNMAAQRFGNDIRKDAFRSAMHFSFAQTDRFTAGSLITRVTNDVTQVQNMAQMIIRGYVRTMILLIGGIIFMTRMQPTFGLIVLIAMPFILLVLFLFLRKITPNFGILQERLDDVNNIMQENVAGNRVVKAYIREEYEAKRFGKANEQLVDTQLRILILLSYMTPILNILMNIAVLAVIRAGSFMAEDGMVSPGDVMAAITYLTQILNALMRLGMMFQNISRGMASAKRIEEVLKTESEIKDGSLVTKANPDTADRGSIEFKNVSFGYAGREEILHEINLKIEPGETIGILGMTGSGKSSLVSLIPRFYDVTDGEVFVDGVNVKDYEISELRRRISIALQRSQIFQSTIRENILWGKEGASEEEIQKAAEIARADEFIATRKEGMDTEVASSGHSLSGGQKQRLAIARAVLKDAEIYIFDDSTSALDLKTESELYKGLKEISPDTTKIIIAQRIASVMDADRIVVLDGGRIAALGSHEKLLKKSEIYRDIFDSQMGGEEHG